MTGKNAWLGEQMQRDAALAVGDDNAAGGVLGQQVRLREPARSATRPAALSAEPEG